MSDMARYDLLVGLVAGGTIGFLIGYYYSQAKNGEVTSFTRDEQGRIQDIVTKKV